VLPASHQPLLNPPLHWTLTSESWISTIAGHRIASEMLPILLPVLGVILCLMYVVLRVIYGHRPEPVSVYLGRPVTTAKVLALVLGSSWFFAESCTSTLVAGSEV